MARIWNEYTAPTGQKYYYNLKTKQSTWEKPLSFYDTNDGYLKKQGRLNKGSNPHFVLPLENQWYIVICDDGEKFFHNATTKESSWELLDERSRELLKSVDKEKLILLVGIARGYGTLKARETYEGILHELEIGRHDSSQAAVKASEEPASDRSIGEDTTDEEKLHTTEGIIAGYSSSSEEQSEEEDREDSGENDGTDDSLAELNMVEVGSNDYFNESRAANRSSFFSLLVKYDCDPFSIWSVQVKKVQNDPEFYKIANDALKESLFEEWCQSTLEDRQSQSGNVTSEGEEEGEENKQEEDLQPTKYHYLAQIVSKSDITRNTIFLDIKAQNKANFKKYKIKDFIKDKQEQVSFVSSLLFFYKKMNLNERKSIFKDLLSKNERTIKENISHEEIVLQEILAEDIAIEKGAYYVETQLLKLEKIIGIKGNLQNLATDTKYYVLGIQDKLLELKYYLKSLVEK